MNIASTHCLVLKRIDHGESDILVTIYSETIGRVTGIAKGAKRSKKRFVNKLELFSNIEVQYKPSRSSTLLFMVEAELENAYLNIRHNHLLYTTATYLCELVTRFTRERDADSDLYNLLKWALSSLHHGERFLKTAALFHIKLLTLAGYQPEISSCCSCMTPLRATCTYTLVPGNGALLCSNCRSKQPGSTKQISLQALRFMERALNLELHQLARLQIPDYIAREILDSLYQYSRHILQQDIHTWKMLTRQTKATS